MRIEDLALIILPSLAQKTEKVLKELKKNALSFSHKTILLSRNL